MRSAAGAIVAALVVAATTVAAAPPAASADDPCAGAPRAPYVDVADGHTHATAVDCLHGLEVIRGRFVDAFEPGATLRRDQMATIVAGAVTAAGGQLPAPRRGAFRDVGDGPHRDAIERLAAAGIVEGRSPGRYDPGARVPRGQMTAFLVRAHDHVLGGSQEPAPDAFGDDDGHPHEATIDRAAQLGLASGRSATRFAPQEPTLRGQTATFVSRLFARAAAAGSMTAPSWGFDAHVHAVGPALQRQMRGTSWHAGQGCPAFADLRLLEVVHRGFDGRDRVGLLVLHRDAAADVRAALERSYASGFAIQRMRLIDRYGGDDDRSMAANNTSAFNCRTVAGTSRLSEHAFGRALDINPVQNPYVSSGGAVSPAAGRGYLDRSDVRRGMLVAGDATVTAFRDRGWGWGGDWSATKDYQHLSASGR